MGSWLRGDWSKLGCTAIAAHNDEAAIGVLKALREADIQVPSDVSVVGFDGTELAAHSDPPLTTWKVPLEEIGARGVKVLLRQMKGESALVRCALAGQLQIGESTAPSKE
jgi:LacI family transcriptional regulator